MSVGDRAGCLSTCHLSESSLDVSESHITPTEHVPYHHRGSIRLNNPLLTNRVYGLMMSSPYSHTCILPIQLETRLVRPGNVFPVINSPMVVLSVPGEE
ncbi:hypothetical protein AVEN_163966-1 [Araneus ventricosus]|uniref:Uncharacterized protein n=1 Tax=Araneus ventricosus TaxID=182803 RepID=A0A4Y2LY92_ARAVE|nr:hypothetical protein AVEN_263404-1 [Araneus ventricosus]GBN19138.1 hypothetical protein AVEN_163966-1 [Araneus ventricosus]